MVDVGLIEDVASRYSNEKVAATVALPGLEAQSYNVIDPELVSQVKEIFQQVEQRQYVARQLQLGEQYAVQ